MTAYNVLSPAAMAAGQPEDISVILSNFQAIAGIINGQLDNTNLAPGAAIAPSKLAGYPGVSTAFLRGDGVWASAGDPLPARLGAGAAIVADCNLAVDNGWYMTIDAVGSLNQPPGGNYGILRTERTLSDTWVHQWWYKYGAAAIPLIWHRTYNGSVWSAWEAQGVLLRNTTATSYANQTGEVSMASYVIPAGTVGINSILRFVFNGSFRSQSTGDNNITYRIKVGGITIWASQGVTYNNGAGTPDGEIFFEWCIQMLGAVNLWQLYGIGGASRDTMGVQAGIGKPSGSAMSPFSSGITDQTVNFGGAVTVEMTMQMLSGNNNNIVRHRSSFVELL